MSSSEVYSYYLKLTNSVSKVELPYPIKNAQKLQIMFVKYTTATASNDTLIIKITKYDNNVYFDGSSAVKCVKMISLPDSASTQLIFENNYVDNPDVVMLEKPKDELQKINIELLINGSHTPDISPSNPLYLQLKFW